MTSAVMAMAHVLLVAEVEQWRISMKKISISERLYEQLEKLKKELKTPSWSMAIEEAVRRGELPESDRKGY